MIIIASSLLNHKMILAFSPRLRGFQTLLHIRSILYSHNIIYMYHRAVKFDRSHISVGITIYIPTELQTAIGSDVFEWYPDLDSHFILWRKPYCMTITSMLAPPLIIKQHAVPFAKASILTCSSLYPGQNAISFAICPVFSSLKYETIFTLYFSYPKYIHMWHLGRPLQHQDSATWCHIFESLMGCSLPFPKLMHVCKSS